MVAGGFYTLLVGGAVGSGLIVAVAVSVGATAGVSVGLGVYVRVGGGVRKLEMAGLGSRQIKRCFVITVDIGSVRLKLKSRFPCVIFAKEATRIGQRFSCRRVGVSIM